MRIFLAGDVMTGRGVDQILGHPGDPALREPFATDAATYCELAEAVNGPLPKPVNDAWIWGDLLEELDALGPQARIVNLETAVTVSDSYSTDKDIHYRMHPDNIGCLVVAGIDVCALANNHVLDFGQPGLTETLGTLDAAGVGHAGAGRDLLEARKPAVVDAGGGGVIRVASVGVTTSGIPPDWVASAHGPGVDLVSGCSEATAAEVAERVTATKGPGDLAVVSIHWGSNWGYDVAPEQVRFAHALIDRGVDVVHGHSSHHPRPIEVYHDRLVLYGCGDLINDYEGISGYESFRGDLSLAYLPAFDAGGALVDLQLLPMQIRRMRLQPPTLADLRWMGEVLNAISRRFGTRLRSGPERSLMVAIGE